MNGRHYDISQQKHLIKNKMNDSTLNGTTKSTIFQKIDDIDKKYREAQSDIELNKGSGH